MDYGQATPDWVIRLRGLYDLLGPQEQKVADYILGNMDGFLEMSIARLAVDSGTSKSTIVRFCNRLGYKGLKEFKIRFCGNQDMPKSPETQVFWGDSLSVVKTKVFNGAIDTLRESYSMLDDTSVERAAEALYHAKNIDIYGQGGSTPIAMYLRHQLMKIGVRSSVYTDAQSQHLSLSQFGKGDVAVAISCSGESHEIVSAMEWVKSIGLFVIVMTDFPDSSLGRLADIVLCNTAGRFFEQDDNTFARIAQLATVDCLYLCVAMKMGPEAVSAVRQMNKRARNYKYDAESKD